MKPIKIGILAVCFVLLAACGNGNGEGTSTTDCGVADQNGEIQVFMTAWYLEYFRLKQSVNPELYGTPDEFLRELISEVDFVPGGLSGGLAGCSAEFHRNGKLPGGAEFQGGGDPTHAAHV